MKSCSYHVSAQHIRFGIRSSQKAPRVGDTDVSSPEVPADKLGPLIFPFPPLALPARSSLACMEARGEPKAERAFCVVRGRQRGGPIRAPLLPSRNTGLAGVTCSCGSDLIDREVWDIGM